MNKNSFYAILFRQRYIKRWGLMKCTEEENLEQHAAETAMLAHALSSIGNAVLGIPSDSDRAVTLALFHDATEVYTGDLPTPVKYYSDEIRESYKQLEKTAARRLLETVPEALKSIYGPIICGEDVQSEEDRHLHLLVKAADKLSAYIKCLGEQKAGNHEFDRAAEATLRSLRDMHCPEADWFIENMLDAFTVSLDEIGL